MTKSLYEEPAFLKDIHRNQISNYKKTRAVTTQERIIKLVEQAHQDLFKLGLRTVEFIRR